MPCPYCAAFGRDLFGRTPPAPAPRATPGADPPRGPPRAAGEDPGDGGTWCGEEPSWPVAFGGLAGARAGSDGASRMAGSGRH
jgi:hypothetical protein